MTLSRAPVSNAAAQFGLLLTWRASVMNSEM